MGRKHNWFTAIPLTDPEEGTDRWALEHNLVSLTPLRLDLTDEGWLESVEQPIACGTKGRQQVADSIAWVLVVASFAFALTAIWFRPDLMTPPCPIDSSGNHKNGETYCVWLSSDSELGRQIPYCTECVYRRRHEAFLDEETTRGT